MALTVFYSWQTDIPSRVNRNFIQSALEKAIRAVNEEIELQSAPRGEFAIDTDTANIPGMPPIAETIHEKILNCTIFVPDLTFVGKSPSGRHLQNPNVLIEFGWAHEKPGLPRVVAIMNSAFGVPSWESLPFDMRHLRFPITYELPEDAPENMRTAARDGLVKSLTEALRAVAKEIPKDPSRLAEIKRQVPLPSVDQMFLKFGRDPFVVSGLDRELHLSLPHNEYLFLSLYSLQPHNRMLSSKAALDAAQKGDLLPMGAVIGANLRARNGVGAFVCTYEDSTISHLTQIFQNGEIFGVDFEAIDKKEHMERAKVSFGFFPTATIEQIFVSALNNYLSVARQSLGLAIPLQFAAGATGVRGFRLAAPNDHIHYGTGSRFSDPSLVDQIVYTGTINSYDERPATILRPFFNKLWEECGEDRPPVEQF